MKVPEPKRCPHCGQIIAPKVRFGGMRGRIYQFILSQEYPPSAERIASHIYSSRRDGGPLYANQSVQVQIYFMNRVLGRYGVRLASPNAQGYQLFAVATPEVRGVVAP